MDPFQNSNFFPNFNFPNQPQNSNMQSSNPNIQRPEHTQNMGTHPNFQTQYMMPPNFRMQYPYNHPYMPYGYQPAPGNTFVSSQMNWPNAEPTNDPITPGYSSGGSQDIPQISTQISLGDVGGDNAHTFVAPTPQSSKRSNYASWTTEENKALLTGYFHFSTDSELGANQKGDTFWGKITEYVNENSHSGIQRTQSKCQSHFKDINKKISIFVGCYSRATREKCSGFSDDDYISKALKYYHDIEHTKFSLIDEWKLVRHRPKYMTGTNESESNGSNKRKSGSDDVESVGPTLVRPEGRDATKKKARASSSLRKKKMQIEEEIQGITSTREDIQQIRTNMLELATSQEKIALAENGKLWMQLHNKDRDEKEEQLYNMLSNALFDH